MAAGKFLVLMAMPEVGTPGYVCVDTKRLYDKGQ